MEEESAAGLKHGGHVTICRHLLCVATGSYLVLFLESLKKKKKKKIVALTATAGVHMNRW